jgi:hypothetical protein
MTLRIAAGQVPGRGASDERRSQGWREARMDAARARQDAEPSGPRPGTWPAAIRSIRISNVPRPATWPARERSIR